MGAEHDRSPKDEDAAPAESVKRKAARARASAARAEERLDVAHATLARLDRRWDGFESLMIRREIRKAQQDLEESAEQERARERAEGAADAAFMRDEIVPMLEKGWTREQLAEIGITGELLERLGLLHHFSRSSGVKSDAG